MARVFDPQKESQDLGFGTVLSKQQQLRLLNRDGSFNVKRFPPTLWEKLGSYHSLVTMSWPRFFLLIGIAYFAINVPFALAYYFAGPAALSGDQSLHGFLRCFFFSIDTFATIGYGNITPATLLTNFLVTIEAIFGLLSVGLVAGLVYARFARPTAKIAYSKNAVIAPYRGLTGFMFRLVNARQNELIEVNAKVILSRFEDRDGRRQRVFHNLELERAIVIFFPLSWTVVHPIDEQSPLWGWTDAKLREAESEFLILLTATDEVFATIVHSRTSYSASEVIWDARFSNMFVEEKGELSFDPEKLDAVEKLRS
ncbi:K+ channel, inward rectifier [Candidatus Koribacter versatilis Ellin345]|uniref:K+ channel, inward rectifier n=1 Tax=Koribacter versatilis (strain Ellin345) TaxID=204669 RepID=Q1IM86_KORVE|nr:ion channel [Candidatus Koribacter versatilis]ABF42014.1 K+ channel, inward rectifier [Candidatus Koribacter versatilis Ellin345]